MKTKYQSLLVLSLASLSMTFLTEDVQAQKKNKNKTEIKQAELWELDTMIAPIPIGRRLFTDKIEKSLDEIDARDGEKDGIVKYKDETTSQLLTQGFMSDAPRIIILTENLNLDHNEKVKYHKALQEKLRTLQAIGWDTIAPGHFTNDLSNLRGLIVAQYRKEVLPYVQKNSSLLTLQNIQLLENNVIEVNEAAEAKAYLYKNLAKDYPAVLLDKLPEIKDQPYADSVVADIARVMPGNILSLAKSGPLSSVIKRNADPLVQTIVRIVDESKKPEKLLPFLGPINRGEKSISEVDGSIANDNKYYEGLVDLLIANEQICKSYIDNEIRNRTIAYANKINDESKDNDSRFATIQNMRDVDYYVMIIGGKDQIYASSFTNGLYPLLIKALNKKSGKELLLQMNNYHFRTFIRLCAEHNTLAGFLKTMTKPEKNNLFKEFTEQLELGDINDVSEAAEVANTFPYLNDEDISDQLRSDFYVHYDRVKAAKNEHTAKGILTYGIMQILFNHDNSSNKPVEESLGMTPVAQIPYDQFLNSTNEIVEQIYFYSDKGGKSNYNAFISEMKANSAWKVAENASWTKITSNSDKKITIYANKAVSDTQSVASVNVLKAYLQQNNIAPVIAFHFGPIGYLSHTLGAMNPNAKIVMADNTFGDDNLIKALNKSTTIHLLGCKETATPVVSTKVFSEVNKQLSYGRNLNWNDMWKDLSSYYTDVDPSEKEIFSNYIQPDKNPGVLFVKAYMETKRKRLNK